VWRSIVGAQIKNGIPEKLLSNVHISILLTSMNLYMKSSFDRRPSFICRSFVRRPSSFVDLSSGFSAESRGFSHGGCILVERRSQSIPPLHFIANRKERGRWRKYRSSSGKSVVYRGQLEMQSQIRSPYVMYSSSVALNHCWTESYLYVRSTVLRPIEAEYQFECCRLSRPLYILILDTHICIHSKSALEDY